MKSNRARRAAREAAERKARMRRIEARGTLVGTGRAGKTAGKRPRKPPFRVHEGKATRESVANRIKMIRELDRMRFGKETEGKYEFAEPRGRGRRSRVVREGGGQERYEFRSWDKHTYEQYCREIFGGTKGEVIDFKENIRRRLEQKETRPRIVGRAGVRILEIGPGLMRFPAEIKRTFGSRVEIHTLGLAGMPSLKEFERRFSKFAGKEFNGTREQALYNEYRNDIIEYEKNRKLADRRHVGAMETMRLATPEGKPLLFDMIVMKRGAIEDSPAAVQAFESILNHLAPGGEAFIEAGYYQNVIASNPGYVERLRRAGIRVEAHGYDGLYFYRSPLEKFRPVDLRNVIFRDADLVKPKRPQKAGQDRK